MKNIWRAPLMLALVSLLLFGAWSCVGDGDDDDSDDDADDDIVNDDIDDDADDNMDDDADDDVDDDIDDDVDDDIDDDTDDDVDDDMDDDMDNIIFSEYIEGSSNNKALELYNAGSASVDMSMCAVQLYLDGADTPTGGAQFLASVPTPLAPGNVYVVCNPGADADIIDVCDLQKNLFGFDGDDALELICYTTTMDVFGQIGQDPGDYWGIEPCTTQNQTLVRKNTITQGDLNGADAFDPAVEWDCYDEDTFTFLGEHTP